MQNLNMGVDAGSNRGRNALLFDLKGVGRNRYIDVVNPNYVKTEKGRPARSQRSETLSASPALEDESLGNLITTSPEKPSAQYKEVQKEPAESDPDNVALPLCIDRRVNGKKVEREGRGMDSCTASSFCWSPAAVVIAMNFMNVSVTSPLAIPKCSFPNFPPPPFPLGVVASSSTPNQAGVSSTSGPVSHTTRERFAVPVDCSGRVNVCGRSSVPMQVLWDQNFREYTRGFPLELKLNDMENLQNAIYADTHLLAHLGVVDYSLLLFVDEDREELRVGMIDIFRPYTWDKHVENIGKSLAYMTTGLQPTVIGPTEYMCRFKKAMSTFFAPSLYRPLVVPLPTKVSCALRTAVLDVAKDGKLQGDTSDYMPSPRRGSSREPGMQVGTGVHDCQCIRKRPVSAPLETLIKMACKQANLDGYGVYYV
eukprot:GHVT01060098.1.p1 GENE.GHVT01060098.1~~GHVT01060098.1.p1  ORF type:complete len:424 (+),score=22.82 GHVT01060098.1:1617-2888(+)